MGDIEDRLREKARLIGKASSEALIKGTTDEQWDLMRRALLHPDSIMPVLCHGPAPGRQARQKLRDS